MKNSFTLTTEPIERWLQGVGCKDLENYYRESNETKKRIIDKMYHEYKRLNLSDTRILRFLGIMEDTQFIRDRDKNDDTDFKGMLDMLNLTDTDDD